jgi:hypothetical protein
MRRRPHLAVALIVLAAATLTACTTDSTAPTPSNSTAATSGSPHPSVSTSTVGGMTSCTKDHLAKPASEAAQALGNDNVYAINDLQCAAGWAVTSGVLANKTDPNKGAPTSFVFRQEGQFWVVQDKAKVCGTNPTTTTAPKDAKIPAALFILGCAAG